MRVQQRLYRAFFLCLRPAREVASSGKDNRRGPDVSQMQEHLYLGEQGWFRPGQSCCWWGGTRSVGVAGGVLRKSESLCHLPLVWALAESWRYAEAKIEVAMSITSSPDGRHTAGRMPELHRPCGLYCRSDRLCCTNPVRDSPCESSVVAVVHEQTEAADLPHHELA